MPELGTKEIPVNRRLQGVGDSVEAVVGWRSRRFGRLGASWTWKAVGSVFCCQRTQEVKKHPGNVSLQGWCSSPKLPMLVWAISSPVVAPAESPGG